MPEAYAVQPAVYIQNEQKIGKLTLRYGFRYSTFTNLGGTEQRYFDPVTHELTDVKEFPKGKTIKTYGGLEPRISASLPLTEDLSIKGAYSRTYQYLQQARVSITG